MMMSYKGGYCARLNYSLLFAIPHSGALTPKRTYPSQLA